MKQKIKKLVKILAVLSCLLILLVIAAYFVFTKYYLPRYFENDLLPQLAKRAGLKGFSGSIKRIGPFGADLGSLTIGPDDNPTLKVQSVKIDYSLNRLYSGRKMTITRAIFIEPELKCRIKNGDLYTGGETFHKFILDLCKGLAPGKGDQFDMELSSLEARNGTLLLSCGSRNVKVPFKLLLNPINKDWKKIAVKGIYEFPDATLPLSAEIDLENNKAEFSLTIESGLKNLARAGRLLNAPYVPSPGKLSGSVKCKVDGKAAVSPFKIKDYIAEGMFNSAQWKWSNFSFNAVDNGSGFKLHCYHDIMEMKISELNANFSFDTIISDFRCTYRRPPRNHFDFSGKMKLADKTIRLLPGVTITPIGRLLRERQFTGLYKPADDYWRFNTGDPGQEDIPEKCAFTINKKLTVAEIRELQLSGQGRGQTGKLEFAVKVPLFSSVSSATKRNIDNLRLNSEISFITGKENIFNNVRIKAEASFSRMILCESNFTRNIGKTNLSGQIICSKQKNNVLSKITVDGKSTSFIQSGGTKGRHLSIRKPEYSAVLNLRSDNIVPPVISNRDYKISAASLDWTSPDIKISCSEPQINDFPGKNKERLRKGSFGRLGIETKAGNIELWLGKYSLAMPENSGSAKLDLNFGKAVISADGAMITTGSGSSVLSAIVDPLIITTPDKIKIESSTNTLNYKDGKYSLNLDEVKNISSLEFDPTLDPLHGLKAIYSQVDSENLSGIYNKNKLAASKFSAETKIKFKKNSSGNPVISSAASLISGNSLSMEGDGLLACANKLIIGHKLEKDGAQRTLNSLRFNFSSASFNTQNIMLDKLDGAIGLNIVNGKPGNGDINVTKGNLNLPKYNLDLRKVSFRMPFSWPLYKSNGDGTLSAAIKWRKFGLGDGNFDISIRKQAVLLRGVFSKFPAPGERALCFGRAKLSSDDSFKLELDLSVPEQKLKHPYQPGEYFPELDGISFTGKAHAQFNIKADSDGISQRQLKLSLQNSNLNYFGHIFNKASTICVFEDFMKLESNSRQMLNFDSMKLGQLELRDGSCSYQLTIPGAMKLNKCNGKWLGADVDTGAIKLSSSDSIQTIRFKCKKIPGKTLLKFIGFKMPVCPADFSGNFNYTVNKGKGSFSDTEFQTMPGENLTIKLPDLKHLLKQDQPTGEALTAAALSDFKPNWVKLLFSSSNDNTFDIELSANGRPATPLPFAPGPGNSFVKVSPDAVNAVSGEMELKLQISRVGGNE